MSSRWVPWHAFWIAAAFFMLMAGTWQWDVTFSYIGADGTSEFNARNLVYAFQWWIFAAFGIWFWWRFLRDQRDAELAELAAAVEAAPEQAHDMSVSPVAPSGGTDRPELISLDDTAEKRRARATESLAGDTDLRPEKPTSVDTGSDAGPEGTRT